MLETIQDGNWTYIHHKTTGLWFRYRYLKAGMANLAMARMGNPSDRELKTSYVADCSKCRDVDPTGKVA